jgi:hypothetical protein
MPVKFLDATAPPLQEKLLEAKTGLIAEAWRSWFGRLPATLNAIPSIVNTVSLATQSASIGTTNFAGTSLLAGVYRVSYHARISQAASISSSLTITIAWTEGAVGQSYSGPAITGNTTSTGQNRTLLIRSDAGAAVNYSTSYASNAAGMQYSLDLVFEKVKI